MENPFRMGSKDVIAAVPVRRRGGGRPGPRRSTLVLWAWLVVLVLSAEARGEGEGRPPGDAARENGLRSSAWREKIDWLVPLAAAWRGEYMRTYLPGYLFRKETGFSPYAENGAAGVPSPESAAEEGTGWGGTECLEACRLGERYLEAGFLPEAFARFKTAADQGCTARGTDCRPLVGLLKVCLAMGRLEETSRLLVRLQYGGSTSSDPLFVLVDGLVAGFRGDYRRSLARLDEARKAWHLCPNMEGIAGRVLFMNRRYDDARNVFRVARHARWRVVRQYGTLGVADSLRAVGRWAEAEALYEGLAETGTPLGILGLAEFRLHQGKTQAAEKALEELERGVEEDYWKGIAVVYRMSLATEDERWRDSLRIAEDARGLVLPSFWAGTLGKRIVKPLNRGIEALWSKERFRDLVILAEHWRGYRRALPPASRVLIARAYEKVGLTNAALQAYSEVTVVPEALWRGAKLAWREGRYERAEGLLREYLAVGPREARSDAKALLASILARDGRIDEAGAALRGIREVRDPWALQALSEVEASLGKPALAYEHLKAALAVGGLPERDRPHLLYRLGELAYRMGDPAEALRTFRLCRREGEALGEEIFTAPMEALCLIRTGKAGLPADTRNRLAAGTVGEAVQEIAAVEELVRVLGEERRHAGP